jgi:hypothetical protein
VAAARCFATTSLSATRLFTAKYSKYLARAMRKPVNKPGRWAYICAISVPLESAGSRRRERQPGSSAHQDRASGPAAHQDRRERREPQSRAGSSAGIEHREPRVPAGT